MAIPGLDELQLLHAQMCQAVGDPRRIQILYALHDQPLHVTGLAELLNVPQPTISRHLALLRERALVIAERDGQAVIYRLADERIIVVLDIMRQMLRDSLARRASALD
ncbi:MAG: metalloregulator ArsR/SmtB family transcription factor [Anaerolinea sp.]|nr:metalloregulator ArsR/SmtB family transcription factor [Anaerolinea sp.]